MEQKGRNVDKNKREINKLARRYGFATGEASENGKLKFRHKINDRIVYHGSTVGNNRTIKNLEQEFKKVAKATNDVNDVSDE